jgi:hypothetical protein
VRELFLHLHRQYSLAEITGSHLGIVVNRCGAPGCSSSTASRISPFAELADVYAMRVNAGY